MSGTRLQPSSDQIRARCDEQRKAILDALRLNALVSDPAVFSNALKVVSTTETVELGKAAMDVCQTCSLYRKRSDEDQAQDRRPIDELKAGDTKIVSKMARLSDSLPLDQYSSRLRYVPRLVNVVTLATLKPVEGSTSTLPLPLDRIAKRCTGAFFAPKRFSAVQLAFRSPRCRMLIFETGRLVGTGGKSIVEARLATLMACVQMSKEADVHMQVESFEVVNLVGAVALKTTIDCEEFQKAHSSTTMLDRSSFVGMTWRPRGEPICIEIYSTGRANVSKARNYTDLLESFARMIPELLRYSSSSLGVVDNDALNEEMGETEDMGETEEMDATERIEEVDTNRLQDGDDEGDRDARATLLDDTLPITGQATTEQPPLLLSSQPTAQPPSRPLDRLRSLLGETETSSANAYNPLEHRVRWDVSDDDEMYDDLYNQSDSQVPEWWEPHTSTQEPTEREASSINLWNTSSTTSFLQPGRIASTRQRFMQQHSYGSVVPVRKSNQKRFRASQSCSASAEPRISQGSQRPKESQGSQNPSSSTSQPIEEDSDDMMSGWAVGPGVS